MKLLEKWWKLIVGVLGVLTIFVFFVPGHPLYLYDDIQRHALRTFGTGVVFAGFAALFGAILLWRSSAFNAEMAKLAEVLKKAIDELGVRVGSVDSGVKALAVDVAKANAALADLKKSTDEAATKAATKADDLAKAVTALATDLTEVKKNTILPAPPATPPAAPPAAPTKPTKADALAALTDAVDGLSEAANLLADIRTEEDAARTAENAALATLGGRLGTISGKLVALAAPPAPPAPPAAP